MTRTSQTVIPDLIGDPDMTKDWLCTAALKPLSVKDIDIYACYKMQQASYPKRLKSRHISAA